MGRLETFLNSVTSSGTGFQSNLKFKSSKTDQTSFDFDRVDFFQPDQLANCKTAGNRKLYFNFTTRSADLLQNEHYSIKANASAIFD